MKKTTRAKNSSRRKWFTFKRDNEYYTRSVGRKIADFFIGIVLCVAIMGLYIASVDIIPSIQSFGFIAPYVWIILFIIAISIKRKYIALGMILPPTLLFIFMLIVLGSCLLG